MEEKLNKILTNLVKNGSSFDKEDLIDIQNSVKQVLRKDQSIMECLQDLSKELEEQSEAFIYQTAQVISGLSSCIYLPNSDGSYSITIFGGKTKYGDQGQEIDEKTVFDLASITKLYTFLLSLILIQKGYLKLEDRVKDLDSRFESLDDYTIHDILKMSGSLKTNGRVTDGKDSIEALEILQTLHLEEVDLSFNSYTDMGFLVLSKVIEKIVSEKSGQKVQFDQIMNEYLLKPWGLEETLFHPKNRLVAGNGSCDDIVHDPKARLLGGAVGSAGLFATSNGLTHLADRLFAVQNVNFAKLAGTIIYPNSKQNHKGYAGIYQKHPLGLDKTFVPNEYGTNSFAHQGFTGAYAVFDPKNKIHNNILVSSIKEGESKKPDGFFDAFTVYQIVQIQTTLKMYLLTHYYQMLGCQEEVKISKKI